MPHKMRNSGTYDELMRIQEAYGAHFKLADQSLFALWMAKHQITPSEESQWNYMGKDYRRLNQEGITPRYEPVAPKDARIYHINNGHKPIRGYLEAQMVAHLGPRIAMNILSLLSRR